MGFNFGAILYMALGVYLVAGLILGVVLFTVGTFLVRWVSNRDRDCNAVLKSWEGYPGVSKRMGGFHQSSHA